MKNPLIGIIRFATPVAAIIGTCVGVTWGQSALPDPPVPPQSGKVIWQTPQIPQNPLTQSQNQYTVAQNNMQNSVPSEVVSVNQLPSLPPERANSMDAYSAERDQEIERSLEALHAEFEKIKKELAKKSDKRDTSKSIGAPNVGGRLFIDSVNVMRQNRDSDLAYGPGKNYMGVREARIALSGAGFDFIDYKVELGFENYVNDGSRGTVNFKDVFVGFKSIPLLGYVRVGNQYLEDGGSEVCNGSTNYTFMEIPSPAGDQFTSRRLGISSRHMFAKDRGRFFLGVYNPRNISEEHRISDDNQGISFNTRLTYAPYFKQEGRCMFLLGGYYNYTDPRNDGTYRHTVRPGGWGVGMNMLDSGTFYSSSYQKAGFETVYQNGRFAVQTDVFLQAYGDTIYRDAGGVAISNQENKTVYGGFIMLRYMLTPGDYRKYNQENAAWGSVNVSRPFVVFERGNSVCVRGPGAWEVAGVYGFMDSSEFGGTPADTSIRHGNDNELGFALNWYWNSNLKWCVNYVHQFSNVDYRGTGYDPTSDYLGLSCRIHF